MIATTGNSSVQSKNHHFKYLLNTSNFVGLYFIMLEIRLINYPAIKDYQYAWKTLGWSRKWLLWRSTLAPEI